MYLPSPSCDEAKAEAMRIDPRINRRTNIRLAMSLQSVREPQQLEPTKRFVRQKGVAVRFIPILEGHTKSQICNKTVKLLRNVLSTFIELNIDV